MKTVVIAAGYATRLGELTRNFPKPLLKIGERTILGRLLDDIDPISDIDEHIIITNHRFAPVFEQWAREQAYTKPIRIVDDGTSSNETRLGAVGDLLYAMEQLALDDDLLVVAADNLLFFHFQSFVDFAKEKQTSCIMYHEQPSIENCNAREWSCWMRITACWKWRKSLSSPRPITPYRRSISTSARILSSSGIVWRTVADRTPRVIWHTIWWIIQQCTPGPWTADDLI